MFGERLSRLAIKRCFGELGDEVEGARVEVDERGAWGGMREETGEARRRAGFEIPGWLDRGQEAECATHARGRQWVVLRGIVEDVK